MWWCPDGAKVKQDTWSLELGVTQSLHVLVVCPVSVAGHAETRQAYITSVWDLCNTFLYEQKNKANQPVVFVKCHHLKRTTKADFTETQLLLGSSSKMPSTRKNNMEVRVLSPPLTGCVKMSVSEGKRWRIQWYILLNCLMFQTFVNNWEWK